MSVGRMEFIRFILFELLRLFSVETLKLSNRLTIRKRNNNAEQLRGIFRRRNAVRVILLLYSGFV